MRIFTTLRTSLSLSLSLLKATHSEVVRASAGRVNAEPPTPKLQRIFEHQRRQERRQPKRTKMASGTLTVTNTGCRQKLQRRCNELTRSCACSRRSGGRSCCRESGSVPFGFDADTSAARPLNAIKQNQTRSREIKT